MTTPSEKQRRLENEGVFRQYNEGVQQGFEQLKQKAHEEGWEREVEQDDIALYYYCECSDENCQERILLKPSAYNKMHVKRDHFIVIPGHENSSVDTVVKHEQAYNVVRKFKVPPKNVRLHKTSLENV